MGTKSGRLGNMPSMPRSAKAAQECECGCGGETKGGYFIPGHDARRLGWAIRIHRGFDTTGITPGELKAAKKFIADNPKKFAGPSAGSHKPKGGKRPKPEAPKPEAPPQPAAEAEGQSGENEAAGNKSAAV